jgi:hypothetical protein
VRGGLVNADIDAAAAIAFSKLAALDSANILVGNGSNVATKVAVTGDVTISNAGVTAIGSAKVTAPMLTGAQTGSAPIYGCRAWVNFDGTRNEADTGASTNGANVKVFASGNVTSVLKNSTGNYTVTFTTAMPDANYATVGSVDQASHASVPEFGTTKTSSAFSVVTTTVTAISGDNRTLADSNNVSVAIFR